MTKKAILTAMLVIFAAGCTSTTLTPAERIGDVFVCLTTALAAGADVALLVASKAADDDKALDIIRKFQEGTKTSSVLMAIPACAKVYANALQVIAEHKAKGTRTFGIADPFEGIHVSPDRR